MSEPYEQVIVINSITVDIKLKATGIKQKLNATWDAKYT